MLGQRCRLLTSIGPTLCRCLAFAGYLHIDQVGLRPSSLRMGLISQLLLLLVVGLYIGLKDIVISLPSPDFNWNASI